MFGTWCSEEHQDALAFVPPEEVIAIILSRILAHLSTVGTDQQDVLGLPCEIPLSLKVLPHFNQHRGEDRVRWCASFGATCRGTATVRGGPLSWQNLLDGADSDH